LKIVNTDSFDYINAEVVRDYKELKITWDIVSQPRSTWDWIGIFKTGEPNHQYIYSTYVSPTKTSFTWKISGFIPGPYEVRYFSNSLGKYTDFRKSPSFQLDRHLYSSVTY